jgi:hypothetical protein
VSTKLAESRSEGHNRILTFKASGKELWGLAKPFLRTPVKKRMWVAEGTRIDAGLLAGESALAEVSDLNPPQLPVLAVPPAGWNWPGITALTKHCFSYARQVDRFNLYLSLMDAHLDERVAKATERLEATLC